MVGILDLFSNLGSAAGFPFGAPNIPEMGSSFTADPQTGDIGGAPSWGKPPVPGGPSAAPDRVAAGAPGGADIEPGVGAPMAPPGGKPIGLLRGGLEDSVSGPGDHPPLPLIKPGLEGTSVVNIQGVGPGEYQPSATLGPPIPPGLLASAGVPGGRSEGPPLATAQQAAAARITPGTPAAVSGPTGAPPGAAAVDPALRTPYAAPASPLPGGAVAGSAPATAAGAAPGGGMLDKMKGLSGNKDFMGALGKLTGAMGGGGGGGGGGDAGSSGSMGDPTQGARANASKLFESIMAGKGAGPVAPIPQLPPGILELFQGRM